MVQRSTTVKYYREVLQRSTTEKYYSEVLQCSEVDSRCGVVGLEFGGEGVKGGNTFVIVVYME